VRGQPQLQVVFVRALRAGRERARVRRRAAPAAGIAFDGTLGPAGGMLRPDPGRPGLGLEVKWRHLERFRVYGRSRA